MPEMKGSMKFGHCDVAIIGAGGAGMMCAIQAGRRGRSVVLLEHAQTIGKKILISGGGRCNFTNVQHPGRRVCVEQPALLHLSALPLPPRGLYSNGAGPRHRLPRKEARTIVL